LRDLSESEESDHSQPPQNLKDDDPDSRFLDRPREEEAMGAFKTTLVAPIAAFLIGAASTAAVSDLTKPLKAESVFKSSKSRKADVGQFVRAGRALGGPDAPAGYWPLGIAKIDGQRVVIYFRKGAKLDDAAGQGHGSAEVFDSTGHLRRRFIYRENLHSPPQIAEFIYVPER
jgi:hypothetical protein